MNNSDKNNSDKNVRYTTSHTYWIEATPSHTETERKETQKNHDILDPKNVIQGTRY